MNDLKKIFENFQSSYNIHGIASVVSHDGNLSFTSSGSFSDNEIIDLNTNIPLGNLMEIFISKYLIENLEKLEIEINYPVQRVLKKFRLEEKEMSFRYLQIDHLLSHGSGFAPLRMKRDILKGQKIHSVNNPDDLIPLEKYFSYPITQLQGSENIFVKNDMDYGLIAHMLEIKENQSFGSIMKRYLKDFDKSVEPYTPTFNPGYFQFSANRKKQKKLEMEYYHLYPSKMGSMTLSGFATILHHIIFEKEEDSTSMLFDHQLKTQRGADMIGIPLRYRKKLDLYQLTSQAHGYTLNLVINREKKLFALVVMNLVSPDSMYLSGKLLRSVLKQIDIITIPSYHTPNLELSKSQLEGIKDRYISFKPNILSYYYNDELGGGIHIGERKNQLYLTNLSDGAFYNSTRVSRLHHLKVLQKDGEYVILGYDDGLYFSKVIITDASKSANIYIELDQGPCLHFKLKSSNIFIINMKQNWDYFVYFKLLAKLREIFSRNRSPAEKRDISRINHGQLFEFDNIKSEKEIVIRNQPQQTLQNDLYNNQTEDIVQIEEEYINTTKQSSQVTDKATFQVEEPRNNQKQSQTTTKSQSSSTTSTRFNRLYMFNSKIINLIEFVIETTYILISTTIRFFMPFLRRFLYDLKTIGRRFFARLSNFGKPEPPYKQGTENIKSRLSEIVRMIEIFIWKRAPSIGRKHNSKGYVREYKMRKHRIKGYNSKYPRKITVDKSGAYYFWKFSLKTTRPMWRHLSNKFPKIRNMVQYGYNYLKFKFANSTFNRFGIKVEKPAKS